MNVVIYARFSSHNQTEQSIEGQIKVCREYANRNGLEIVGIYKDEAKSGTRDDRTDFQRMIKDSEKKHFQGVLVYQLDRFARNKYDSAIYKRKLKLNGVRVLSARENISTDASGILMESVLEGMAEYFSVELGQKVQRGMEINASKFYYNGGTVPLGLKLKSIPVPLGVNGKTIYKKQFDIDEETAPIVKKIFEMYIADNTMADIIRYLNERNIKTSFGKEFNKNSIRTIILNKKYIGVYSYKGQETPNVIPRIIDDDTFYKAQEKLLKNKEAPARTKAKTNYLLTTKLYCGTCKSMMVGISGTSHTGKLHCYYSCKGTWQHKCDRKNVQKDYIEDLVVQQARNMLTTKAINRIAKIVAKIAQKEKDNTRLKQLENALKENDKQKANLFDSLKICYDNEVRKSIFEEISRMDKEKIELQKLITLEKSTYIEVTEPQIKFFLKNLKSGKINDQKYRQMLINVLIYRIYLYDDNLTIVYNTQDRTFITRVPTIEQIENSFFENKSVFSEINNLNIGSNLGKDVLPLKEKLINNEVNPKC